MKKIALFILAAVLVFSFCACADETSETEVITGIPEGAWDRNIEEHWKTDENGEIIYSGEHQFNESTACEICGCEIIDWGDGSYDISDYDGYGNIRRSTLYENGEVVGDSVYEYFYNDYGNILLSSRYDNGTLVEECSYSVNTEGYSVLTGSVTYFTDGTKSEYEYNEDGEIKNEHAYSAEGYLLFDSTYEYELASDGTSYLSKLTETDQIEEKIFEYVYNENGDFVTYTEYDFYNAVLYTEEHEYEFDDEDRKTYHKTVVNGVIAEEIFFAYHEEEYGWWSYYDKQIVYNEDGSYTVYRYDENDELLSEESFDSNGNKQ